MIHKSLVRPLCFATALAAGLFSAGRASAAINYIQDGSFEVTQYATNSLNEVTGQTVNGWFGSKIPFVGASSTHEYVINGNVQDTSGRPFGTTPFGAQFLGLNAVKNNSFHSIESQVVPGLTPGQTYTLTIYIANLDGAPDPNIGVTVEFNSTGDIPIGGSPDASATFTAPVEGPYGATGIIDFVPETLTFTPTVDTIDININNQSNKGVMGIDNVSLVAVPEPGPAAAVLMGLAGLAMVVRRRRAA